MSENTGKPDQETLVVTVLLQRYIDGVRLYRFFGPILYKEQEEAMDHKQDIDKS